MTLAEAIAAIQSGKRVRNALGSTFWLDHNSQGQPVLMGQPAGYGKEVKHVVFSSEHFRGNQQWEIAP